MIFPPFTRSLAVALTACGLASAADLAELQVSGGDLQRLDFAEGIQAIRDTALSAREQIQRIDEELRVNPPPARVVEIPDSKDLPAPRVPRTDEEIMLKEMEEILGEIRATAISPSEQIRAIADFIEVNRDSVKWLSDTWQRNRVESPELPLIEMPEERSPEIQLAIDLEVVREANPDPEAQVKAVDEFLRVRANTDLQEPTNFNR